MMPNSEQLLQLVDESDNGEQVDLAALVYLPEEVFGRLLKGLEQLSQQLSIELRQLGGQLFVQAFGMDPSFDLLCKIG